MTINAGKYRHPIKVYRISSTKDAQGFKTETRTLLLSAFAQIKTTRGYTLIKNNSDFEKAYTNFTIRMPEGVRALRRYDEIDWNGKIYTIEYLNDVDARGVELEVQAKEVTK